MNLSAICVWSGWVPCHQTSHTFYGACIPSPAVSSVSCHLDGAVWGAAAPLPLVQRHSQQPFWSTTAVAKDRPRPSNTKPPTTTQIPDSADDLASHFICKVDKIRASTASSADQRPTRSHPTENGLSSFQLVTTEDEDAHRLIRQAPCKHCDLDPAPTWLIKRTTGMLASVVAAICNASLQSGVFPDSQKRAVIRARLKKPCLSPDDLNSYRPISNLTFLSKMVERVAARFYEPCRRKRSSADQTVNLPEVSFHWVSRSSSSLGLHNDICHVSVIDQGHVVALVLLDLSSAFDTVDHTTLLSFLQDGFAVSDHALAWFHSYLTNRLHITLALKQLYWLPIKFCITFKVATLMYNIFHQRSPPYIKDLVTFSLSAHQRQLRSSTTRSAVVRRTRTQFGRRAFSVSGPDVWNSLPTDIRLIDSQPAVRRALKTHLFNIAFN